MGVIVLILMLFISFSASEVLPADKQVLRDDLHVEQLGKDVWRHISYKDLPNFGWSPANGLVVLSGKEAALVDMPWSSEQTFALFEWVDKNLGAQIKVRIATHSHDDCMGGLNAAHEHGAKSYALDKTAVLAEENRKEVPQNIFKNSKEIQVGARTLRMHFAGGGHTPDNIVVWIPDERILFGGCLVKSATSKHLGYTKEAVFDQWPKTISVLLEEYSDVRIIVPGHGKPGGDNLLRRTLELLEE
jgi:metallo-beta-lactamase class B